MRLPFAKSRRLLRRSEFLAVQNRGKRLHSTHLVMLVRPSAVVSPSVTRLGIVVTKKVGNAVLRNRCKRVCRELFRLAQASLPANLDLVVIPRASLATANFAALQQEWLGLIGKLS